MTDLPDLKSVFARLLATSVGVGTQVHVVQADLNEMLSDTGKCRYKDRFLKQYRSKEIRNWVWDLDKFEQLTPEEGERISATMMGLYEYATSVMRNDFEACKCPTRNDVEWALPKFYDLLDPQYDAAIDYRQYIARIAESLGVSLSSVNRGELKQTGDKGYTDMKRGDIGPRHS